MNDAQPVRSRSAVLIGSAICVLSLAVSVGAVVPANATQVAALFPPWWSAPKVFAHAAGAGQIVQVGAPFVVILRSDQPGLSARLRRAGAVLLLNPLGVGPCGSTSTETPRHV
ncbi:MAG: hypothetical protein ACYDD1_22920 [Caulobacteraceae bacterium]